MLVASWLLFVLWIAAYWITQPYLPEELRPYLYTISVKEPTTFDWAIIGAGMTLTVVSVVASIGVYLFRRWARWLFLWTNLIGIALSPLSGVLIASEWLSPIAYFLTYLTGGILFTMYLPPITVAFEKGTAAELPE